MDDQLERLDELLDLFESEVARQALTDFSVRSAPLIAARSALRSYLSEDTRRLDWLEGEKERERPGDGMTSLFRANLPITRAAIDASMKERPDA